MMNEYQAEASRLAQLPEAEQREVIALYRDLADSPFATPSCRKQAEAKAAALERLLFPRMKPAKPRKKPK